MAETLSRFTVINTAGVEPATVTATAEAVTITVKDLSRTFVRMYNTSSTLTCLNSIAASADPMISYGQGAQVISVDPETTIYWGAADSARFKSTSGTLVITTDASANGVTFEVGELTPY